MYNFKSLHVNIKSQFYGLYVLNFFEVKLF